MKGFNSVNLRFWRSANRDQLLDLSIKWLLVFTGILVLSFAGYYSLNRYQLFRQLPANKVVAKVEQRVRENPRDVEARVDLGKAYLAQGWYDKAIDQFNQALKLDKEHQGALVFKGFTYMKRGNNNLALKQFDEEIKLYKNAGYALENRWLEQAYFNGGVILWKQKKYDKALEYLKKAAEIRKTDADIHLVIGRVYLDRGAYDQAVKEFEEALKFDPQYADAYYGVGLAYEKNKEKGKAAAAYKQAYKIKPDFLKAKKDFDRVFKEIQQALKEKPGEPSTHFELAMANLGMGNLDEAIAGLKEAIKRKADFVLAHYNLGLAYEEKNKIEEAKNEYRETLKIDSNFTQAQEALKRLGAL